jgi:hypothetical protein
MPAAEYRSQATDWSGTTLEVGDGLSPETFRAVAEIAGIQFGEMTTDAEEITHLLSPNDHKEKMPGLRDTGEFGFNGNWLPEDESQSNDATGQGGLVFLQRTRAVRNWRIVLGKSGSPQIAWGVRGFLSKFKPGDAEKGKPKKFTAALMPSQDTAAALP